MGWCHRIGDPSSADFKTFFAQNSKHSGTPKCWFTEGVGLGGEGWGGERENCLLPLIKSPSSLLHYLCSSCHVCLHACMRIWMYMNNSRELDGQMVWSVLPLSLPHPSYAARHAYVHACMCIQMHLRLAWELEGRTVYKWLILLPTLLHLCYTTQVTLKITLGVGRRMVLTKYGNVLPYPPTPLLHLRYTLCQTHTNACICVYEYKRSPWELEGRMLISKYGNVLPILPLPILCLPHTSVVLHACIACKSHSRSCCIISSLPFFHCLCSCASGVK